MKKSIRAMSMLLLFAMLATMLAACDTADFAKMTDREKAAYIIEKTDNYYKNGVEQTAEISCEIDGSVSDVAVKIRLDGTTKRTVTNAESDKMKFINVTEAKSVTHTGTEKETENYTDTTAFVDGYMYMGHDTDNENGQDVFLKSPISASDFSDFLKSSGLMTEEPKYAEICDNVTVTLSEDRKSYIVRISHGKENVKDELTKVTNELTASFGIKFDLVSFELEYTVDAKKLTVSEIKTVFETETPQFKNDKINFKYEAVIAMSTPRSDDIAIESIEGYIETGDLRYAQFLSNKLNGLVSADSIGYTLTSNSKMSSSGIVLSTSEETDLINCGYKDGIYVYSIDAKANFEGQKIDMSIIYNGAQQKIAVSGSTSQSTDTNEIVARMYLINILNLVLISPNDVTSVAVKDTTGDVTTVEFDIAFGERYIDRIKAAVPSDKISNTSAKITAEFDKDMNVISVSFAMSADSAYAGYTYTIKGETIIKSFKDGDVSGITTVKPGSSEL